MMLLYTIMIKKRMDRAVDLKESLFSAVHLDTIAIDHSHPQRLVLRVFLLDQPIRNFYIKLAS